jgi:hypothetical protein
LVTANKDIFITQLNKKHDHVCFADILGAISLIIIKKIFVIKKSFNWLLRCFLIIVTLILMTNKRLGSKLLPSFTLVYKAQFPSQIAGENVLFQTDILIITEFI